MQSKKIFNNHKTILFFSGLLSGLSFAPVFFLPGILSISILSFYVYKSKNFKNTFVSSWTWGFGYYIAAIYWVPSALFMFLDDFWWLIPIAFIFGPLFMAITIAIQSIITQFFYQKLKSNFTLIFTCSWLLYELIISWLFTGFPWALIGYSLSFSDILTQIASIFGIYGISFLLVYISSGFYLLWLQDFSALKKHIYISLMIVAIVICYGKVNLYYNPTELTEIKVRIIQPSLPIQNKWKEEDFWNNLNNHIDLSNLDLDFKPDLIIWPEGAIVTLYKNQEVLNYITSSLKNFDGLLMSGGFDQVSNKDKQHYNAFYAINKNADLVFMYHKQHLVPFGEYIPFKNILPLEKITHGFEDYAKGSTETIFNLDQINLKVASLICYESVFPSEVRKKTFGSDVIVHTTFDTWFGKSSGPYQHFYMSKIRAIENGLPLLRSGNNGVSAIIDPAGRILQRSQIDEVIKIDGFVPKKLKHKTLYSQYGNITLIFLLLTLITQRFLFKSYL